MARLDVTIENLKEIATTVEAIKGIDYAEFLISFFSLSNLGEALIECLPAEEDEKVKAGMVFADIAYNVMKTALRPMHKAKHPDKDDMHFKQFLGDFITDVETLRKKQKELVV